VSGDNGTWEAAMPVWAWVEKSLGKALAEGLEASVSIDEIEEERPADPVWRTRVAAVTLRLRRNARETARRFG
jgi:hypothetical protein